MIIDKHLDSVLRATEQILQRAANAYYNGTSSMEDSEYDKIRQQHEQNRERYPEHEVWKDTILDKVGAPVAHGEKVKHSSPMLSLRNLFVGEGGSIEELNNWLSGLDTLEKEKLTLEPKVDGLSLRLTYRGGRLVKAATRGDGTEGEMVIDNVVAAEMVPSDLAKSTLLPRVPDFLEVDGEVFMYYVDFQSLNESMAAHNEKRYANPRNAASGILRARNAPPTVIRCLSFLAHGVSLPTQEGPPVPCHSEALKLIRLLGIPTVECMTLMSDERFTSAEGLIQRLNHDGSYPTDGLVVKLDRYARREELGTTSSAPRWAVAIKLEQPQAETILKDITVQVGRTGELTPVALLEPVELDGSTIFRASLHNQDEVARLHLRIGDRVVIHKAGAIIPEVLRSIEGEVRKVMTRKHSLEGLDPYMLAASKMLGVAYQKVTPEQREAAKAETLRSPYDSPEAHWSLLEHIGGECPSCGSRNIQQREGTATSYLCANPGCKAQLSGRIQYMASRPCLDIDGLGEMACDEIAQSGGVSHPFDILYKTADWFARLTWITESGGRMTFGKARGEKVYEACGRAQQKPLRCWIASLGIPTIGINTSSEISRLVRDVNELFVACSPDGLFRKMRDSEEDYDRLKDEHSIGSHLGPVSLRHLVEFVNEETVTVMRIPSTAISDNYDPKPSKAPSVPSDGLPFAGKSFVITGTLSVPRSQIQDLIKSKGGQVATSLSAKTSVLVAGAKAGSKLDKAVKLDVEVWDEELLRREAGTV